MTPRAPKTNSPPDRRTKKALERRDKLIAKYIAEGMSKKDATERTIGEMRDNPRGDWRA